MPNIKETIIKESSPEKTELNEKLQQAIKEYETFKKLPPHTENLAPPQLKEYVEIGITRLKNSVEEIINELQNLEYFHSSISQRAEAEALLAGQPERTFLLRQSSKHPGIALSYIKSATESSETYYSPGSAPGNALQLSSPPTNPNKFESIQSLSANNNIGHQLYYVLEFPPKEDSFNNSRIFFVSALHANKKEEEIENKYTFEEFKDMLKEFGKPLLSKEYLKKRSHESSSYEEFDPTVVESKEKEEFPKRQRLSE